MVIINWTNQMIDPRLRKVHDLIKVSALFVVALETWAGMRIPTITTGLILVTLQGGLNNIVILIIDGIEVDPIFRTNLHGDA